MLTKLNSANVSRFNILNSESNTTTRKTEHDLFRGGVSILGGTYLAKLAITSGLPRMAGIRVESHTTTKEAAKKIIEDGCILDPKFGGVCAAKDNELYKVASKNSVHITGIHKDALSKLEKMFSLKFPENPTKFQQIKKQTIDTTISSVIRKSQKLLYQVGISGITSKGKEPTNLIDILTRNQVKTFYVGGTDNYFNKNFIPDPNDYALKTNKKLKVFPSKLGAIFNAFKREGLSGIKQNVPRVCAGVGIALACGYGAYKLVDYGMEKLGVKD